MGALIDAALTEALIDHLIGLALLERLLTPGAVAAAVQEAVGAAVTAAVKAAVVEVLTNPDLLKRLRPHAAPAPSLFSRVAHQARRFCGWLAGAARAACSQVMNLAGQAASRAFTCEATRNVLPSNTIPQGLSRCASVCWAGTAPSEMRFVTTKADADNSRRASRVS